MKKIFVLLFGVFFYCAANAQVAPIYFYGDQVISDSTLATSYGVYGKLSGEELYVLKMFDLENNLGILFKVNNINKCECN